MSRPRDEPDKQGVVLPPVQPSYPSYPGQQVYHQHQAYPMQQGYPPQLSYPPQPGFAPQPTYSVQQGYPASPPAYTQPFPGPVQQQPGQLYLPPGSWLTNTSIQDYMRNATSFTVKQKVELLEVITGIETANRYTISDQMGRKILYATEEPNCLGANVCGKCRSFDIRVRDINNTPLLNLKRGLDCGCCFGCIAPDKLIVSTPSGQHLGSVVEQCDILFPRYTVRNESDVTMLKVKGPLLPCSIFSLNAEFRIKSPGGPQVGVIAKKWSGLIGEFFTDADTFTVTFPIDLDVNIKAVCLGLLFLIDFEYFESGGCCGDFGGRRLCG